MDDRTWGTGSREVTAAEVFSLLPGLARLMPEIGARWWKCHHAAEGGNWDLAAWQLKEMRKLFRLGKVTRPKYSEDIDAYLAEDVAPVADAIESRDLESFREAFQRSIDRANDYHRKWKKHYIVWKLPADPPPDLVIGPVDPPPAG